MNAEIIAIGDELTSGQRLDTNSQWLSQRLGEIGVHTLFHTTVADDLEANAAAFRLAAARADVVLSTGGLGPTADDLTREAICLATGQKLVASDEARAHIEAIFARRKRPMPQRNIVQAMFPESSRMIPNPHGTAPGIDLEVPREKLPPSRIFALPGVPAEMREMWEQTVQPAILAMIGPARKTIRHRQIKCFGVGESDLEQMLPDLIRRGRQPSVGITVSQATITLRVTAAGESEQACLAAMEPTVATIRECLGSLAFGEEDDELQHAVVRILTERGQSLCVAECGTGGLICNWLSEADPHRQAFRGGVIVADPNFVLASGPTSDEMTIRLRFGDDKIDALAAKCRAMFSTDYCLAVGSFPAANQAESADEVQIALAHAGGVLHKPAPYSGHPDILKSRLAKQALNLMRLFVLDS